MVQLVVKNLPAMQETQIQSLGWEDPLEKEMAIHSSTLFFFFHYLHKLFLFLLHRIFVYSPPAPLAWEIPRTVEPDWLQSMEIAKSQTRLSD